jgi:DNA recombination protein RmuC
MFVPIEPAFLLALRERPEIFQEAYDRQVVMVTHSTLMATLAHRARDLEERAHRTQPPGDRRARGLLYDKFIGFTEDLGRIGKSVKEANVRTTRKALGKLSDGQRQPGAASGDAEGTGGQDQQEHPLQTAGTIR